MTSGIRSVTGASTLAIMMVGSIALGAGAVQAQMKHEGVEATVMTFTGPQIAEPLQRRAPDFKKATGATINVVTVPFSDLYSKLLTDFATGTNSIDGMVFAPQWMVDYIEPGYLEDLTERVNADEALQWDDVAPFFRDFSATYNGRIYTIPLDGDFQMVYYRSDLLDEAGLAAPRTWEDYIEIAKAFHGQDLNGDDKADYGSCIAKKRNAQSYWMVISVAAGFLQSQGTGQGAFFSTEDMSPLFNNEAVGKALDIYAETTQYGPPDEINLDVGDTRGLFTSGRCALSVDWGDIGTLAIDPATSKVQDKVGAVILPGASQVLDRETGELVDCDAERCPHAVDGINHAPFSAFGGWSGAVNAASSDEVKAAVYDFFSYLSQPEQANEDVTIGITGFNPYRISQFENLDLWLEAGMSKEAAENYLGAIADSLNSPNMVLDLRIPQNQRYEQIVLDTAIHRMLAGEIDRDQAMADIETGWNEITEELGAEEQLEAYKATLGIRAD
jgi:multiple sugar transport system substrate-binding protein